MTIAGEHSVAREENPAGSFPALIICEHASNHIPPDLSNLGLNAEAMESHIAWDPGALAVAQALCKEIDAPLIHASISRLVIDLNRTPSARDSIVTASEDTPIPGNLALVETERKRRRAEIYDSFHRHVDAFIQTRMRAQPIKAVVSIHSFTPVYRGINRPWHIGLIHDKDQRLAQSVLDQLSQSGDLTIGMNEPYNPGHGVYHTLDRHACGRGLAPLMVEIRNDIIRDQRGQAEMARRFAHVLMNAIRALPS